MTSFQAHVELLEMFLRQRDTLVEAITELLNAQRMPDPYRQDAAVLSRRFEDCFYSLPSLDLHRARLRGELQQAHWAAGFRPRAMPGMHNDLVDPAQMMIRGFHLWQQTRWPGRTGRVHYAQTLFNVYLLRCLELLSMRLWDAGPGGAGERLSQVQRLLDELWSTAPQSQPVLVRDARWLIPVAQSPTTDDLAPYFDVLERLAAGFADADRVQVHKAAVMMAGGHLRSQLRHHLTKHGVSLDDPSLILTSRNSNALDFAVLIHGLVALLDRYEETLNTGDSRARIELAGAVCQGISADPDLFVNRIDLLGAYSMIEPLFSAPDRDGGSAYTATGRRHVEALVKYRGQIGRLCQFLHADCQRFRPTAGRYSPYGVIYGFSSNLTEHMVLKSLQPGSVTPWSLEDVFTDGDAAKLAWVSGWRKLPHVNAELQRLFDYPLQFAEDIYTRIERALHRGADGGADAAVRSGRLVLLSEEGVSADSRLSEIPDLPVRYFYSSDVELVAANKAHFYEHAQLMRDRQEGTFIVSYQTGGGWSALSKDVLTEVLGEGRDVKLGGLPRAVVDTLRLLCPDLVALPSTPGSE